MDATIAPPRFLDPEINKLALDIQAASSSLGFLDEDAYYKEKDCGESIRDIIRCLRRDDDQRNLRRDVLRSRLIQTDLIPLIRYHSDDEDLCNLVVRLLMNLTNPPLLVYEEELPGDKVERHYFLELVSLVQLSKEFFNDYKFWEALRKKLENALRVPVRERSEEQQLTVERILILLRNVLHIPADPAEERTDNDASVHDQVLYALKKSDFDVILLYLASSEDERELSLHVLEIISLMMREQNPADIGHCGTADNPRARSETAKDDDEAALMAARERELELKRQAELKFTARSFKGSYQVKNMKGVGSHDVITHKPVASSSQISFDKTKQKRAIPKNRYVPKETDPSERRRSAFPVRVFLKGFATEFLHGAYNSIMSIVKSYLSGGRAQANDESYYMWALRFFMEFNRCFKFRVDLVSETIGIPVFHYVQVQIEKYSDMMVTDKRKISLWAKRLHLGIRAYHELLMSLAAMTASRDDVVQSAAKVIKSNIFYMTEYRDLLPTHLHRYNRSKLSIGYLKDLVETNHVYLKLLQDYTKVHSKIVIQRKIRRTKKKKNAASKPTLSEEERRIQLEERWSAISADVTREIEAANQSTEDLEAVVPYDVLLEEEADRKADAIRRIRLALNSSDDVVEAIKLLRSARVMVSDGTFGPPEGRMSAEDETSLLKEIFLADIGGDLPQEPNAEDPEEGNEEDEEEEEAEPVMRTIEKEMEFTDFVLRYANAKVVENYSYLLQSYDRNSAFTNHCVVKMFHRLAFDCHLPAVLFQASLFRTFQKIMRDPASRCTPSLKELATFGKHLWRKFSKVAQDNPLVFVELLFWKTHRDAVEITEGYGSYTSKSSTKGGWTQEQEFELERLFNEFKGSQVPGKDVVQLVTDNLIDRQKTTRMVARKLREMGLLEPAKGSRGGAGKILRSSVPWGEEEIGELRQLWDTNKESMDPLSRIFEGLTLKRAKKRIGDKLLELGLVASKAELRKGKRKSRQPRGDGEEDNDDGGDGSAASDESEESTGSDEEESVPGDRENSGEGAAPDSVNAAVQVMGQDVLDRVQALLPVDGAKEVFTWLARCLRRSADDVAESEADPDAVPDLEGVALVPLTAVQSDFVDEAIRASASAENKDAPTNSDDGGNDGGAGGGGDGGEEGDVTEGGRHLFHLLKRLGFSPPGRGGQEAYWRLHVPPKNPRNCAAALRLRAEYLERAAAAVEAGDGFREVPDGKFFGEGFRATETQKAAKSRAKVLKRMERRKLRVAKNARESLMKKLKLTKSAGQKFKKPAAQFKSSEFIDSDDSDDEDDASALDRILGRAKGVEAATHALEELDQLERDPSSLRVGSSVPADDAAAADDDEAAEESPTEDSSPDSDSDSGSGSGTDEDGRGRKSAVVARERRRDSSAWERTRRLQYSSDSDDDDGGGGKKAPPPSRMRKPVPKRDVARNKENVNPDPSAANDAFEALLKATAERQKQFDALHESKKTKATTKNKKNRMSLAEMAAAKRRAGGGGDVVESVDLSSSSDSDSDVVEVDGEDDVVTRPSVTDTRKRRVLSSSSESEVEPAEPEKGREVSAARDSVGEGDKTESPSGTPAVKRRRVGAISSDEEETEVESNSNPVESKRDAAILEESSDEEVSAPSGRRNRVRQIIDSDSD